MAMIEVRNRNRRKILFKIVTFTVPSYQMYIIVRIDQHFWRFRKRVVVFSAHSTAIGSGPFDGDQVPDLHLTAQIAFLRKYYYFSQLLILY